MNWEKKKVEGQNEYVAQSVITNNRYEIYRLSGDFALLIEYDGDNRTRRNEIRGTLKVCKGFAESIEKKRIQAQADAF